MKANTGRALCLSFLLALLDTAASHAETKATPLVTPQAILISVEFVDVHLDVMDKLDKAIPDGPKKASLLLEALIEDQVNETENISIQTPNDFPGAATYYKDIGFTSQDKAHPGKAFVSLITSINATPHLEGNDIISVKMKTMVTRVSPQGLPNTIGQGRTFLRYYFKSGETSLFRGQPLDRNGKLAKANDSQALEEVSFVTVTVLPVEAAK